MHCSMWHELLGLCQCVKLQVEELAFCMEHAESFYPEFWVSQSAESCGFCLLLFTVIVCCVILTDLCVGDQPCIPEISHSLPWDIILSI